MARGWFVPEFERRPLAFATRSNFFVRDGRPGVERETDRSELGSAEARGRFVSQGERGWVEDIPRTVEEGARGPRRVDEAAWRHLKERGRWWVILGLTPTAALVWLLWTAQAIDPLTAPALLLDRLLQVGTLLLAPAALLVLLAPPVPAVYAAVCASLIGIGLGSSVALTGLLRPQADWEVIGLAIAVLVFSSAILWKVGSQLSWLKSAGAKSVAVLVAAAVPLLQLWNSASFLPSRTEANLTQSVTAEFSDDNTGVLRYTTANGTQARMLVIYSELTFCWWAPDEEVDYNAVGMRDDCTVLRPVNERAWIAAESDLDWQIALQAPVDKPKLSVRARIGYARGDRLRISSDMERLDDMEYCSNVVRYRLSEESRVKAVAQDDKYLVYADYNGDGLRHYFYDFGDELGCPGATEDRLAEYFGTTNAIIVYETWVGATPRDEDNQNAGGRATK